MRRRAAAVRDLRGERTAASRQRLPLREDRNHSWRAPRRKTAPGQDVGESLAGPEEHHAHTLRFQSQGFGNFIMCGAFDVSQPKKGTLLRLELGEDAHHVVAQLAAISAEL